MKILYFSDRYSFNVMGVKRSLEEEVKRRSHSVIYRDKKSIRKVVELVKKYTPDQVWLVHSNLRLLPKEKAAIKVPVVGFGFSDPYYFSPDRFKSYDCYITNSIEIFEEYGHKIPMHYNPTSCDFTFHSKPRGNIKKEIDISMIGVGLHPRFEDERLRITFVEKLRKRFPWLKIHCYGDKWGRHPRNFSRIEGDEFLNVIWKSRLGLDIQEDRSPPSRKMFEYLACGTPIITKERPEIARVFKSDQEVLVYDDLNSLIVKVNHFLSRPSELQEITDAGRKRCVIEHDIMFRVTAILKFLEETF